MKKYILSVALFLFMISIYGQRKSSVDIATGINHSYRQLSNDSGEELADRIIDVRKDFENAAIRWHLGVNFNHEMSDFFHLRTGVRVSNLGYSIGTLNYITDLNPMDEGTFKRKENHLFIELPVAVRVEFNNKKFTPFLEMGLAPSWYQATRNKTEINASTETEWIDYKDGPIPDWNEFHLIGSLSGGVNYTVSESWQLFAQPTFRYHITKLVDAPIGEHLYSIGLEMGARKQLN